MTVMVTDPAPAPAREKSTDPDHVDGPPLSRPEPDLPPPLHVKLTDVAPVTRAVMPMRVGPHPSTSLTWRGDKLTAAITGLGLGVGFGVGVGVGVGVGDGDGVGLGEGEGDGVGVGAFAGLATITVIAVEVRSPARACKVCGPTVAGH